MYIKAFYPNSFYQLTVKVAFSTFTG